MRRASQVSPSTTHYPSSSSDSDSSSLSSWWGGSSTSLSTPCFSASSSATASPSSPHSALSSVILSCTLASALCADSASTLSSAWPVSSPLFPSIAAALQNATASSSSSLPASNSAQMNSHSQLNTFDGLTPFPHPHTADFSASSLKAAPFSSYPWLPPNSAVDGGKTALELESNEDIRVPSTASLNLFLPDSSTKPPRNDCLKVDNTADMMLPLLSQGNAIVSATPSASPRHQVQMLPFITPYDPTQSVHPSAATSRRPSLTAFTTSPNAAIRRFFPSNPLQLAASANSSLSHNQLLPALPMAAHTQLHPDATDRSPIPMVKAEPTNATLAASHKRKHSHLQENAADDAEQHIAVLDEKTRQATEGFAGDGEGEDDEDDDDDDDEDSAEEEDDKEKHGFKAAGAMANRFAADGLSCHQCKTRRTGAELLFCHHQKKKKSKKGGEKACRKKFCFRCIQKFYENLGSFEELKRRELEYVCPGCRGDCSCASCRRSRTRKQMKALIKSQGFLPSQANQLVQSAFAMPNNAQGAQTGKRAKLLMPKGKKPKSSPLLMGAGSPLAVPASTVPVFMPQYVLNQQQGHGAHFSSPNVVQVCPPLLAPTAQQCHSAFASAAPSPSSAGSSSHSTPLSSCSLSSSLSSPALTHPADRPSLSPALSVNSSSTVSSAAASAVPSSLPSPAGSQAGNIPVSEVAYSAALSNLHGLTQELQTLISRQPELANQVFQMLQSQIKQHNERQTSPNLTVNGNANAAFNSLQSAQYAQTAQAPMSYNAARAIANAATALLLQSNPTVHFPYPQQTHAVDSIVPLHIHSQSQSQSLTNAHSHSHPHSHSHSLAQSHVHMHASASASALTAQSPLQSVSQPHSHGSSSISPAYVCHPNPALQ